MPACSVFQCKNRSETSSLEKNNITFHLFPKDIQRRYIWVQACGNHPTWYPKRTSTICSNHFEISYFINLSNNKRRLNDNAVPTLKLSKNSPCNLSDCETNSQTSKSRDVETSENFNQTSSAASSYTQLERLQIEASARERKLKKTLQLKNRQIKRLQSRIRYFKQRVAGLKEKLTSH